jgi:hypothetical protein
MLWQGAKWRILKNFNVQNEECHNYNLDPSFGHNLWFKYSNWSCKPILNVYVPRDFQWYKELFNPISFDPCNCPLKIRESIGTPTPKVGAHLRMWGSFLHTFLHSWEHEMWLPCSLLAHTFTSPCFGREPKAKVATICNQRLHLDWWSSWGFKNLDWDLSFLAQEMGLEKE